MQAILDYIEQNYSKTLRNNKEDEGTLIGLPYQYNVAGMGDRFKEMYYWGTYFTNVGLLISGREEQAKNNVNNMLFMVEKYGFVPNANRRCYLDYRSQPPFLFMMVKDVYEKFGDTSWLKYAYECLEKEYNFWQTKRLSPNGLNFYGNHISVTEDKVPGLFSNFAERTKTKRSDFTEEEINKIAHTVIAWWENGWDFTSRFQFDGEFYNPVCLNSLLYGLETTMQEFSVILNVDGSEWQKRAEKRKELMDKFLYNKELGIYMDWNFKEEKLSDVQSAASLYPLFVKLVDKVNGEKALIEKLMLKYGVTATVKADYEFTYQWDYPSLWPPLQYIVYIGCCNYGLTEEATTIKDKFLSLVEKGFEETGLLWEKYNGIDATPFNIEYPSQSLMGWSAQLYLYFLSR